LAINEQWSESSRYNVAFNALRYALTGSTTENYSLTFGIDYKYSETLSFNFMAGGRKTDTETSISQPVGFGPSGFIYATKQLSSNSYGPLFGAGLTKQFERGDVGFNYSRSTNPSGLALFLISDTISVSTNYGLSEHLKFMVSGSAIFTTASGSSTYDRNYYAIESKLSWDFNKHLSLIGGYRYRMQDITATANSGITTNNAESNSIFIYFDYHFDELTTNRF
jgi:hypothetical protein